MLLMVAVKMVLLLLLLGGGARAKEEPRGACSTCQQLAEDFSKGYERTAKQNFGGGNTAWEERKLSKYETSEIRLLEIVEGLCDSSSFECNRMVEEHEELLETWWFKRKEAHPDLRRWLCVDTIGVCCPTGTFGRHCDSCVGGPERPCHGNGVCDGDGTRGGSGECSCDRGYAGASCLDCADGHFSEARNDTFAVCTECHQSCSTCTGPTNQDCGECKEGWEDVREACVDVDECSSEAPPCEEGRYCVNTDGSYACRACSSVCSACTGPGADQCRSCAGGHRDLEGTCADVDECSQPDPACAEENQKCINTQGSYMCVCAGGYEDKDGKCVQTFQPEEVSEATEATGDPHGEL